MEFYKIKNPIYNQYVVKLRYGYIRKSKNGRMFKSIAGIKNHIKLAEKYAPQIFESNYDNWLIMKITENKVENIGIVKNFR